MAIIPVYISIGQSNMAKDEIDAYLLSEISKRGQNFEFVKLVVGSTPYALATGRQDWHPDSINELYDELVLKVNERIAYIEGTGHSAKIATLFSVHGESDAFTYAYSEIFEQNIRYFISSLKSDLNDSDMEFVFSTVHPNYSRSGTDNARNALFAIQEDTPNFKVIDTAGLSLYDGVHYDLESRSALAEDLVEASRDTYHPTTRRYTSISSFEYVMGSDESETIVTDYTPDVVYGLRGDDVIYAGGGDNFIRGGAGDDKIVTGVGNDNIRGGSGDDKITSGTLESISDANINASIDHDIIFSQDGRDFIIDYSGNDYIDAGAQGDVIYAYSGSDRILGRRGNDKIFDEIADNYRLATNVDDKIFGGSGDDYIRAFYGRDYIEGGSGNDTIITGVLDDTFHGDSDSDVISGGRGNDLIKVYDGNNLIYGNDGADTFVLNTSGLNRVLAGDGNDVVYLNIGSTHLFAEAGDDTVYAGEGSGDDTILGQDGADIIHGGAGNDLIYGGRDNDVISGDAGNDLIYGNRGDDKLYGGSGADVFYGGSGADTFIFKNETAFDSVDKVKDFSALDNDKLDFSDILDHSAYDPLQDAIDKFIEVTRNGSDMHVSIDRDGDGAGYTMTRVTTLEGYTANDDLQSFIDSAQILL